MKWIFSLREFFAEELRLTAEKICGWPWGMLRIDLHRFADAILASPERLDAKNDVL